MPADDARAKLSRLSNGPLVLAVGTMFGLARPDIALPQPARAAGFIIAALGIATSLVMRRLAQRIV